MLNNYCSAFLTIFKGMYQLVACILDTIKLILGGIGYMLNKYYDHILKGLGYAITAVICLGIIIEFTYFFMAIFG